jgi:hypothetical protein
MLANRALKLVQTCRFCTLLAMKPAQIVDAPPRWATTSLPGRGLGRRIAAASGLLMAILVTLLTGVALWIRVDGLPGWDGTLNVDEARLAMAARGVLESGLPRLPSGWVYTRGLLATYLTAPSLALLGETDFAARLPAVLAGTALIPVAYLLGREVAGRLGGTFVAGIVAGHPSFVVWSRQAWFYAVYLLLFAAALLFILRALRTGRRSDQIAAGALVGLCAFAHEVGIFLLAPLLIQSGLTVRRAGRRHASWLAPVASLALVGLATVLLWLLVTRLRADSLVGSYGEIEEYLSPALEWPRVRFYLRMLLDGPGLLLLAALGGLPLAIHERRAETLILWLALLPTFVHAALLIPRGPQERYGLSLVLVVAVLGAQGARLIAERAVKALARQFSLARPAPPLAVSLVLGVMFLMHQDVGRAVERAALSSRDGAMIRQARELGIGPGDVVMTDVPTTVGWYVGGLDFWISSRDYEKYTTLTDGVRRDVHTGAVLVRSRGDFERLVGRPLAGQRIWVIASGRSYQWGELVDDDLKTLLERATSQRVNPGDNSRILLINVPSGS